MEFLIRRTDGEWFDGVDRDKTLRPNSFGSKVIKGWGDHRIEVQGVEVSFSYEDPGWQIVFEGPIEATMARQIVQEIAGNITAATGQGSRIVEM